MYRIMMYAGRTQFEFMGDFEDYKEAYDICKSYNWVWYDEHDFEWQLEVEEVEYVAPRDFDA